MVVLLPRHACMLHLGRLHIAARPRGSAACVAVVVLEPHAGAARPYAQRHLRVKAARVHAAGSQVGRSVSDVALAPLGWRQRQWRRRWKRRLRPGRRRRRQRLRPGRRWRRRRGWHRGRVVGGSGGGGSGGRVSGVAVAAAAAAVAYTCVEARWAERGSRAAPTLAARVVWRGACDERGGFKPLEGACEHHLLSGEGVGGAQVRQRVAHA